MSLAIEANILGQLLETGDNDGVAHFNTQFELANRALQKHGLTPHFEPQDALSFKRLSPSLPSLSVKELAKRDVLCELQPCRKRSD